MPAKTPLTFAFEYVPEYRCVVLCQGYESPGDAEWDNYLDWIRKLALDASGRLLVHSDGGSISREQRARLVEATQGRDLRTAVVTSSASVHFVASAISLAKRNLRCFTPAELLEAFEYLELEPEAQPVVRGSVERLRASLGLPQLSVAG